MNRQDRKYIIKELSEYGEWMRDSSAYDCDDTIDGLIKNTGDYYEVIVDIHLINGDCITVRNNCKESYLRKEYIGDSIEYSDLGDPDGIGFDVNYIKNGAFHQARIPVSSICWIEGHTKDVDWKRVKLDIATIKDRGLWNAFLRGKNMKPTNQTEKEMTTIEMKEKQAEYAANIAKVYTESAFDIGYKQGVSVAVNDTISWIEENAEDYGIKPEHLLLLKADYKEYFSQE